MDQNQINVQEAKHYYPPEALYEESMIMIISRKYPNILAALIVSIVLFSTGIIVVVYISYSILKLLNENQKMLSTPSSIAQKQLFISLIVHVS